MKILYDYQIFRAQRYGGISRYFYELTTRIAKISGCKPEIMCIGNINYYFKKDKGYLTRIDRGLTSKAINLLNRFIILIKLKGNYDIFHPTYYNPYMIGRKHGTMTITVYDMIHEIFPELLKDKTSENKKKIVHEADHIISISESTKRDILKYYNSIPESKITVIYIGTDMKKCMDIQLKVFFPEKYILFVGNREIYKNFAAFTSAIIPILKENPHLHVVCAGGGRFTHDELELMEGYNPRFHQINCDDRMLSAAYTYAQAFVFPSKYEGFGIPTLEAFSCDCPVVLSNTSSMPEVGGDAALYFDPNSIPDMTAKIRMVLEDEALRQELIEKGQKQVQSSKFNWDVIAQQTYRCYEKICGQKAVAKC